MTRSTDSDDDAQGPTAGRVGFLMAIALDGAMVLFAACEYLLRRTHPLWPETEKAGETSQIAEYGRLAATLPSGQRRVLCPGPVTRIIVRASMHSIA
jgi:hypothetical protein